MSSSSLPAAPSLEQLRKQSKELLRAHRAGDAGAVARVAAHHPHPEKPVKLAGTQLVVAREHGFPSWPRLRTYVERVAEHGPALQHAYHEDLDYYEGRALRPARVRAGRDAGRGRRVRGAATRPAAPRPARAPWWPAGTASRRGRRCAATSRACATRASPSRAPTAPSRPTTSTACARELERFPELVGRRRHERQRPARHGGRDVRRAPRPRPARRTAPIRRAATRTAGRRCTRRPTRTSRCWPGCCSTPACRSTSRPAATAARRWSSRSSGAIAR